MSATRIAWSLVTFAALALLAFSELSAAPPSNDECAGAIVVPDGPYPVDTAPVDAIDATPQGSDEGTFSCAATDYTVWYSFTPSVTSAYTITTCPASGATQDTVLDTVIALYTSTGGTCPSVTELACNDSSACSSIGGDWSIFSEVLTAGQTYFIVAGNWQPGGGLTPGNSTYQLHIDKAAAANDTCDAPIPLTLDRVVAGSVANAVNDYQSPATAACFAGIGQTPTTSPGHDIVFTFAAPSAGNYTIRLVPAEVNPPLAQDPTLYASSSCPVAGVVTCLPGGGANRQSAPNLGTATGISNNRGEEIRCLPLSTGQTIYVFVDDGASGSSGDIVNLEVTHCPDGEVEPNDTPATATPYLAGYCGDNEGASSIAPTFHCVLGTVPGAVCVTHAGTTNVNSDCGPAASGGLCFPDSVCRGGPIPGAACVPRCVGGTTGANNGAVCSGLAGQCTNGGVCATNGGCGACVGGPTPGAACTATALCGSGGTCNAGTCSRTGNEGDLDFWSLGNVPAGSKVWAAIEASQANDFDWRMRITSTTETLGFDDDDGNGFQGFLAPVIAGAIATGGDTFVKISRTTAFRSAPYRLYANVTPGIALAQPEDGSDGWNGSYGWPGDGLFAGYLNNIANPSAQGLVKGVFGAVGDADCWQLIANEGDDIAWWGDSNPARADGVVPGIPQFLLFDAAHATIDNIVFATGVVRATGPQTGNLGLEGLAPQSTSFFQHWRARYTGAFELCAYPFAMTDLPAPGPYPKTYAGSITVNCQAPRPAGPGTTTSEASITITGPTVPVLTGGLTEYTVTITNEGTDIAQGVRLLDSLPADVSYLGLSIDDGFGGNNTACGNLPSPGTTDAPIDCTTISLAPGVSVMYTISVQVVNCLGEVTIENTATIGSTVSIDPDSSNNAAGWSFQTTADPYCVDLFCDTVGCVEDACTTREHCEGSVCVTDPLDCDDQTACTLDTCDHAWGCVNDPQGTGCYGDGNPCTNDACDPEFGCIFPPGPAGVPCDDFNSCTTNDVCNGAGECVGQAPCDDGDPCTMEITDPPSGCACSHVPNPGAPCSDGNPCTVGDHCDENLQCIGGDAVTAPAEVQNLIWRGINTTLSWRPDGYATSYQVVRGLTSALPVGPANSDEVCIGPVVGKFLVDDTVPASGTAFWYLVRGENSCSGAGTYGDRSDATPRVTATCP